MAAECVPLKLIDSRNAGVTVTGNSCDKKTELAVGSNLELASGSRLWLQFDSGDDIDLIDSIDFSVLQAEAMIEQMQNQFEGHGNIAPDASNYAVLDAIKKELLDIKVIVHWHIQNNLDKRMEKKS